MELGNAAVYACYVLMNWVSRMGAQGTKRASNAKSLHLNSPNGSIRWFMDLPNPGIKAPRLDIGHSEVEDVPYGTHLEFGHFFGCSSADLCRKPCRKPCRKRRGYQGAPSFCFEMDIDGGVLDVPRHVSQFRRAFILFQKHSHLPAHDILAVSSDSFRYSSSSHQV